MQPRGVLRIAARASIQVEEVGELNWRAAAGAVAVIGAVVGVPTWSIGIDRVITVSARVRIDHFADLRQNRGSAASAGGRCGIDNVAAVGRVTAHLAIGPGVFVGRLGIGGAIKSRIPLIHTGDLVARVAAPTRSPKNTLRNRCRKAPFLSITPGVRCRIGSDELTIEAPPPELPSATPSSFQAPVQSDLAATAAAARACLRFKLSKEE